MTPQLRPPTDRPRDEAVVEKVRQRGEREREQYASRNSLLALRRQPPLPRLGAPHSWQTLYSPQEPKR